jgi:hypothetical protein
VDSCPWWLLWSAGLVYAWYFQFFKWNVGTCLVRWGMLWKRCQLTWLECCKDAVGKC